MTKLDTSLLEPYNYIEKNDCTTITLNYIQEKKLKKKTKQKRKQLYNKYRLISRATELRKENKKKKEKNYLGKSLREKECCAFTPLKTEGNHIIMMLLS